MFLIPKRLEVLSTNTDWHIWTDRFTIRYVDHSNGIPRNHSASQCQLPWSVEESRPEMFLYIVGFARVNKFIQVEANVYVI